MNSIAIVGPYAVAAGGDPAGSGGLAHGLGLLSGRLTHFSANHSQNS